MKNNINIHKTLHSTVYNLLTSAVNLSLSIICKLTLVVTISYLAACSSTPSSIKKLNITQDSNIQRTMQSQKQIMVMIPLAPPKIIHRKIALLSQSYGVKLVTSWPLKSIKLHSIVFEVHKNQNIQNIINNISRESLIDSVQAMHLFQVLAINEKNKTKSMANLQDGVKSLNINKAHKRSTGKNIRIAIIDSGIDINHPEYNNTIEEVNNFVEQPSHSFTSDIHGTAIAGIIASDNKFKHGIIGVSPDVRILAFKACWQTELQWGKAFCNSYSLAKAIDVAILRKVNILNLSLGGSHDAIIDKLIKRALHNNITVVAASGSNQTAQISFPASIAGVIAVSAKHETATRSVNNNALSKKKLSAPGTNIISTSPDNNYDFFSGSSLSTAFVSGSIALLLEKQPNLTPRKIYQLLEQSATHDSNSSLLNINSCAALALLLKDNICKEAKLTSSKTARERK